MTAKLNACTTMSLCAMILFSRAHYIKLNTLHLCECTRMKLVFDDKNNFSFSLSFSLCRQKAGESCRYFVESLKSEAWCAMYICFWNKSFCVCMCVFLWQKGARVRHANDSRTSYEELWFNFKLTFLSPSSSFSSTFSL